MIKTTPMKAIRSKCLNCCGGRSKSVKYCPSDGIHGDACPLWYFRFGSKPKKAIETHGKQLLTPRLMPEAEELLDDLP